MTTLTHYDLFSTDPHRQHAAWLTIHEDRNGRDTCYATSAVSTFHTFIENDEEFRIERPHFRFVSTLDDRDLEQLVQGLVQQNIAHVQWDIDNDETETEHPLRFRARQTIEALLRRYSITLHTTTI